MSVAAALPRAIGSRRALAHTRELVLHLTSRQLRSTHRRTALGWSWPLLLQLTQLGVLVFVFKRVIPLDIPDYAVFVFTGLVFWSFFSGGILSAASSVVDNQALVLEPRTPAAILPLVSILVAGFDLAIALAVLLVVIGLTVGLGTTALFLPVLLVVQIVLMCGVALLVSSIHVRARDTKPFVSMVLLFGFYLTPIFYTLDNVPSDWGWFIQLNPAATLIDGYHLVLMEGRLPDMGPLAVLAAVAVVTLAAGVLVFRRLQGSFVDEL